MTYLGVDCSFAPWRFLSPSVPGRPASRTDLRPVR